MDQQEKNYEGAGGLFLHRDGLKLPECVNSQRQNVQIMKFYSMMFKLCNKSANHIRAKLWGLVDI